MKILKYLSFALLFLAISCDKINEPYLRNPNKDDSVDSTVCPRPLFTVRTNPIKKVLLEDYTGYLCTNCPEAAVEAKRLKGLYGEKLILMSLHTGIFAIPNPNEGYTEDLRTQSAESLASVFGITAFPSGMVNRTTLESGRILTKGYWESAVDLTSKLQAEIDIQIINEYDSASRKLCTHIQSKLLTENSNKLMLVVCLTEDSIKTKQKNSNPTIGTRPEIAVYYQMHVLRNVINSTWGSVISDGDGETGMLINRSYSIALNSSWKEKQCAVIAYVYDANSKVIIQVEENKIY